MQCVGSSIAATKAQSLKAASSASLWGSLASGALARRRKYKDERKKGSQRWERATRGRIEHHSPTGR